MSDREQDDQGPLAPRRPLTSGGSTGAQVRPSTQQTTMAIPVVRDEPVSRQPAPPQRGPQPRTPSEQGQSRPPAGVGADTQQPPRVEAGPQDRAEYPADGATSGDTSTRQVRSRKARLKLARIDPWSVMKMAFALSIALAIVTVVAVAIVWSVLGAAGVWDSINASVGTVLSENSESTFDIADYVGTSRVLGLTTIIAAANVVLLTAIATLAAFLYNLAASLLGGLELTLAEDR